MNELVGDLQEFDELPIEISKEKIDKAIQNTVSGFSHKERIDPSRMGYQIEIARKIMYAMYIDGKDNIIVEAPTGFGKSILGMFLTDVFNRLHDKSNTSYMLTSTKLLQSQYDRDMKVFAMGKLCSLRGQANYPCSKNGENFTKRACSEYGMKNIDKKEYPCLDTCEYINARNTAIGSNSVFNYAYWLTQMNMVYETAGTLAAFQPRQLTIMDECHLIGDIVQNMFGFEVNMNTIFRNATAYYEIIKMSHGMAAKKEYEFSADNVQAFKTALQKLDEAVVKMERLQDGDKELLYQGIIDFTLALDKVSVIFDKIRKAYINESLVQGKKAKLTEQDERFVKFCNSMLNMFKELKVTTSLYLETGTESIVATISEYKSDKARAMDGFSSSMRTVKLQNLDESYIVNKRVSGYTDKAMWMSATIGDIDSFAKQYGIENYEKIYVDSDFLFENCPIYKVTPMLSMTYKNKNENMPKMIQRIIEIIDKHPGEKGLIHTGNYSFARELMGVGHPRLIDYNSRNKEEQLARHAQSKDKVIIGPSLVEGVDLKDELARFLIWMKVPYPSLADKFIKEKIKKNELWYGWATGLAFAQGMGRPIRHKNDWCVTYLMDSSFNFFLSKNKMPEYIANRISSTPWDSIGTDLTKDLDDKLDDFNFNF